MLPGCSLGLRFSIRIIDSCQMELGAWLAIVLFQASKFEPPIYLTLGFVLSNL